MNLDELIVSNNNGAQTPPPPKPVAPQPAPVQNYSNNIPQPAPVQTYSNTSQQQYQQQPQYQGPSPFDLQRTNVIMQDTRPVSVPQINVNVGGREERIAIEQSNIYRKEKFGFLKMFGIIALIVVGFLLLGESLNLMHLQVAGLKLAQIYPILVLIIALVVMRNKGFRGKLMSLLMFVITFGLLLALGVYHSLVPGMKSTFDTILTYNLPSSDNVLNINTYIGDYKLSAKDTSYVVDGTYKSDRNLYRSTGYTTTGNYPYIYFNEDNNWNILQDPKSNLILGLSKTNNFRSIYLKNFYGNYDINLKDVKRNKFQINGFKSNVILTVGNNIQENSEVEVKQVWGDVEINIPKSVAVKLYVKKIPYTPGSMELTNFEKSATQEGLYESINTADARAVLKININMAATNFKVNRIDG